MFTFYMLVIAFGFGDFKCKEYYSFNKPKAEPPFVTFYYNKEKMAQDMDAMPSRIDSSKAFRFDCDYYYGCVITELALKNAPTIVDISTHTIDGTRGKK